MIILNKSGVCIVENFIPFYHMEKIKTSIQQSIFHLAEAENSMYCVMDDTVYRIIEECQKRIQSIIENQYKCEVHEEECATINKYVPGWHLEEHDDTGKTNSGRESTDFSSIIYFNSDFSGGELNFINKKIRIKPTEGMLVISPATQEYLHEVTPILNGERYTATTFWQEKV